MRNVRSTSTFIATVVYLNSKRRICESCAVLTDLWTEPIGLRCHRRGEVGGLTWQGCHGSQLNVPTVTVHHGEWVSVAVSTTHRPFQQPMEGTAVAADMVHPPKVMSRDGSRWGRRGMGKTPRSTPGFCVCGRCPGAGFQPFMSRTLKYVNPHTINCRCNGSPSGCSLSRRQG